MFCGRVWAWPALCRPRSVMRSESPDPWSPAATNRECGIGNAEFGMGRRKTQRRGPFGSGFMDFRTPHSAFWRADQFAVPQYRTPSCRLCVSSSGPLGLRAKPALCNCLTNCSILSSNGPPRARPVGEQVSSANAHANRFPSLPSPAAFGGAGERGLSRTGFFSPRDFFTNRTRRLGSTGDKARLRNAVHCE